MTGWRLNRLYLPERGVVGMEREMLNKSRRVLVREVVAGRYLNNQRPLSWDKRSAGIEKIITVDGETVTLLSNGGQSTPKPGWELLLMREAEERDFRSSMLAPVEEPALTWTLYGIRPRGENL